MVCGRFYVLRLAQFLFRLFLLSNSYKNYIYSITYRHKSGSFSYVFIIHLYLKPEASIRTKQSKKLVRKCETCKKHCMVKYGNFYALINKGDIIY